MSGRYRNIGGPHTQADGTEIEHGEVFTPTEHELTSGASDKFEPVTESAPVAGADIGLRSLAWGSEPALRKAMDADPPVTVEEMRTVEPTGVDGYVTPDVDAVLRAREA